MTAHRGLLRVALFAGIVSSNGCADAGDESSFDLHAQGDDAASIEGMQAQLTEKVAELGFDTTDIAFVGDRIRVEGDIILEREKLIAGAYDPPATEAGRIEKGYRYSGALVSAANAGNIKLAWLTASNPSSAIRNAFINAAGDFNSIFSKIFISQNNLGPAITVVERAANNWPPQGCAATDASCAMWPANGNPGGIIYVKASNLAPGCANWSPESLANRARHELAHALGMHHVLEGDWIFNTASCTNPNPSQCPQSPGYPTVMIKAAPCTGAASSLQPDDRTSIAALYPL